MLRILGFLIIVAFGAGAGGFVAFVGGTAFMEAGRTFCDGAACTEAVLRSFAPVGAALGGLIAFGKAMAWSVQA